MRLPTFPQLGPNGTYFGGSSYMSQMMEVFIHQTLNNIIELHQMVVSDCLHWSLRDSKIDRFALLDRGGERDATNGKLTSSPDAGRRASCDRKGVKIISFTASAKKIVAPAGFVAVVTGAPKAKKIRKETAGNQKIPGGFRFEFRGMSAPSAPIRHLPKQTRSFEKMGPRIQTEKPAQPRPEIAPGMSNYEGLFCRLLV
jgi:hypothetical protein